MENNEAHKPLIINEAYRPLVKRFVDVNNYEKMERILDIGFIAADCTEKYITYKNESIEYSEYKGKKEEQKKYVEEKVDMMNIIEIYKREKKELQETIYAIKENKFEDIEIVRKKEEEKYNCDREYLKQEIVDLKHLNLSLTTNFNEIKEKEVSDKTEGLLKEVERLNNENTYYKKLYVEKSKGTFYENELYPKLEKYNDKELNNKWRIMHVGSSCSEKCDFQFRNKETGDIILIDTKNNEQHSSVRNTDIDKFIKDTCKDSNNAIGGILIANNKISKRKNYEREVIDGKILLYISNFSFDNVAFIFSMLDLIVEISKSTTNINEKTLKNRIINSYKFIISRVNNLISEKRKCEKELDDLKSEFFTLFQDDLEMNSKGIENLNEKINMKVNTETKDILDYKEIETECKIIGKISKYYIKYMKNNIKYIQYFQNNYRKNNKIKAIEKQIEGGVNVTIIS